MYLRLCYLECVDNYSINLKKVIEDLASKYNIEVQSTQFSLDFPDSKKNVAEYLKANKLYTSIIISHESDIGSLFSHFNDTGNCN